MYSSSESATACSKRGLVEVISDRLTRGGSTQLRGYKKISLSYKKVSLYEGKFMLSATVDSIKVVSVAGGENEKEAGTRLSLGELDWRKSENFIEEHADIVMISDIKERGLVFLDFGKMDFEGFESKRGVYSIRNPYIKHVARIRLTTSHFEQVVSLLQNRLKEIKEGKGEG